MGWTDKDTQKETGDSTSKIAYAEHTARDDAENGGYLKRGVGNTSKWDEQSDAHTSARETFVDVVTDAYSEKERGNESYK